MSTDWMWCYQNPKDAAMEIDRLRAAVEVYRTHPAKFICPGCGGVATFTPVAPITNVGSDYTSRPEGVPPGPPKNVSRETAGEK